MGTYSVLIRTENKWEYYEVFDEETHEFRTTAMKLTDNAYYETFGLVLDPISVFNRYGWNIDKAKMKNLIDKYGEERLFDIHWKIYEVVAKSSELFDIYINLILKYEMFEMPSKYAAQLVYNQYQTNSSKADLHDKYERILIEEFEEVGDILNDKKYDRKEIDIAYILEPHRDKLNAENIDKMKNWLTGQVMKELKGSIDAITAKEKIAEWIENIAL